MARKVFLDIGANRGQTAIAAMMFDFDAIYSFEPGQEARTALIAAVGADARVTVQPFGLAGRSGVATLYHAKRTESFSIYADKRNVFLDKFEEIELRRASEWFAQNIQQDDILIAKINVEGAEIEILEDLDKSGLIGRFAHLVVYPDARKVASLKERGPVILKQLVDRNPNMQLSNSMAADELDITSRTVRWLNTLPEIARRDVPGGQVAAAGGG